MSRPATIHVLTIAYVLLPETREHWDGATLRGHLLVARQLAGAVVAVREGRAESALAHLTLPPLGAIFLKRESPEVPRKSAAREEPAAVAEEPAE